MAHKRKECDLLLGVASIHEVDIWEDKRGKVVSDMNIGASCQIVFFRCSHEWLNKFINMFVLVGGKIVQYSSDLP